MAFSSEKTKAKFVRLVRGEEDGEKAWYYILLDQLKVAIYEREVQKESINLKKFGKVLYLGWGENPPAEIKKLVEEQFS